MNSKLADLSTADFDRFRRLIYEIAGIHLSDAKKALLVGRLSRRLRELNLKSFREYYDFLNADASGYERTAFVDAITTNETSFFREPRHFSFLEENVFPRWIADAAEGRREKRIRVWSAACSTGEEPYSLAMCLLNAFPPDSGWDVRVYATDISTKVLAAAREGRWHIKKKTQIPEAYLKQFMLRGVRSEEGYMRASAPVKNIIEFAQANLYDETLKVPGPFDVVFCRNVLIYFDRLSRTKVINRILSEMTSEGLLFLGHAESLAGITNQAHTLIPTVYARNPRAHSARLRGTAA